MALHPVNLVSCSPLFSFRQPAAIGDCTHRCRVYSNTLSVLSNQTNSKLLWFCQSSFILLCARDLVTFILILTIEIVHYFQNHQVQVEVVLLLSVYFIAVLRRVYYYGRRTCSYKFRFFLPDHSIH